MEMGLVCCAAKLRFLLEGVTLLGREPGALSRSTEPRTDQTLLAFILASASVVGCTRGMKGWARVDGCQHRPPPWPLPQFPGSRGKVLMIKVKDEDRGA